MVEKTSQSSRRTSESSLPGSRIITMKSNSLKKSCFIFNHTPTYFIKNDL